MDQAKPQITVEQTYFAERTGKDLGAALFAKKTDYTRFVEQSGLQRVWRKMHWRYYGAEPETGFSDQEVGRDGPKGEMHLLLMNHLRADVTLWLNLASNQRSEMQPEAETDDYEGEIEVKRAKAVLGYYNARAKVETLESLATEYAGVYGMSYMMRWWNPFLGEVVLPPAEEEFDSADTDKSLSELAGQAQQAPAVEAQPIREGRMEAFALMPTDCYIDPFTRKPERDWFICRVPRNRFDLMAQYPTFKEQIRGVDSIDKDDTLTPRVDLLGIARSGEGTSHQDEIACYYFFHADTPACPGGKVAVLVSADLVLEEFRLTERYESMPVKRLACAEIHRTPFGFSPAWGLLAPQEAQASLSTIGLTNARTFGLGIITTPKGADVDETDLGNGLKLIQYTPGLEKPQALIMPETPQQIFVFRDGLISEMGTLIGVNSVVRGDPEASLKSGSALALVQAQAVQFSSDFQKNIVMWKEAHHFDTISVCQMNMTEELLPSMAGDYQSKLLKEFTGKDFRRVRKVVIKGINPMAKTLAGRVQIADTLVERFPNQMTPGDYMRVLETGSIEYMTRGLAQKQANMDRENELLAAGIGPVPMIEQPVPGPPGPDGLPVTEKIPAPKPGQRYVRALITDDHRAHVMKHLEVLDNPAIRESDSPEAVAVRNAVMDHVDEHKELAIELTLNNLPLAELINQPPLQSALPPPPMEAPPGEGGKKKSEGGGPKPPAQSGGNASAPLQPTPAGESQMPRAPQMPVNPSTGQRVENMPGPA